ncbi:hypothetical protein BY458DRAFT_553508 [Sporodiniella umbellata]|nr:hypothetical protein BY458DRAFT_553508 [Sporodiniella umbellata]
MSTSDKWKQSNIKGPVGSLSGNKKNQRSEIRRNVVDKIELPPDAMGDFFSKGRNMGEICIDPIVVFPHTNKPKGSRLSARRKEREQWDRFFDPQHTFENFTHQVTKPAISSYYYKGKWPLNPEDIVGLAPKQTKKLSKQANTDDGASIASAIEEDVYLMPAVPNPTLPNMKHLIRMGNIKDAEEEEKTKVRGLSRQQGSMRQVDIIPCPMKASYNSKADEAMWQERLGLFNAIQHLVFSEIQDGTHGNQHEKSKTARIQRQIKDKAEKIKKEAHVDKKYNDSRETVVDEEIKDMHVKEITIDFQGFKEKHATIDAVEAQQDRPSSRQSFYLFAFGFVLPPLWLLNFSLGFRASNNQTEASKGIDKKWRKYSRNAFCIVFCTFAVTAVIIIVSRPGTVGFRQNKGFIQENVVLFDDESLSLDL